MSILPDASASGLLEADVDPLRYRYFRDDPLEVSGVLKALLPAGRRVLDVGCGTGDLAKSANAGKNNTLVAIEPDPARAEAARELGLTVHAGVLDDRFLAEHAPFDVVTFCDVLEHLVDPAAALEDAKRALRPGGVIIASVPNVAHWSVRLRLLAGRWEYAKYGIMDATHIRWFTRKTLTAMFEQAGLRVIEVRRTAGLSLPEYDRFKWIPYRVRRLFLRLAVRALPEAFACQNVVCAQLPAPSLP